MTQRSETVFETQRLYARRWNLADAEIAFAMYGDPEVTRYLSGTPEKDIPAMEKQLQYLIDRNARFIPQMGSFPVYEKSSDLLVGSALIKPLPDTKDNFTNDIEVGWHLKRSAWGQGFATEFGRKLLEVGFVDLDIPLLHAVVHLDNPASAKVAERLGMTFNGTTTKYYSGDEILHYSMTIEQYRQNATTA